MLENGCAKAERFRKQVQTEHPYIYKACEYIIHQGLKHALEFGVDALGALVGDPFLYEEMELIYYGVKLAAHISFKLYHYLKSMHHVHRAPIEWMHHHEGDAGDGYNQDTRHANYQNHREYDRQGYAANYDYDAYNVDNQDNNYQNYREYDREYDREVSASACQCIIS